VNGVRQWSCHPCSLPDITRQLERHQSQDYELANLLRDAPIAWDASGGVARFAKSEPILSDNLKILG